MWLTVYTEISREEQVVLPLISQPSMTWEGDGLLEAGRMHAMRGGREADLERVALGSAREDNVLQ